MFFLVQLEKDFGVDLVWQPSDMIIFRLGFITIFLMKDSFNSWAPRTEYCPRCKDYMPIKTVTKKIPYKVCLDSKPCEVQGSKIRQVELKSTVEVCRICGAITYNAYTLYENNCDLQKAYSQLR